MSIPVTVVIATRNEERNLPACLQSVSGMDQVFVVDSQSTDRTSEIANRMGAEVVQFEYDGGWPKKRNWALQNLPIRNEWVLVLDADERVGEELFTEIAAVLGNAGVDGYYLRWKFYFLGQWMRHCWRHGWMLRLFRHGKAEYEDLGLRTEGGWDAEVHENLVLKEGRSGRIKGWLRHESRQDLSFWIEKQNEFSSWNAVRRIRQLDEPFPTLSCILSRDPRLRRRWLKRLFVRLPGRPFLAFVWLYVLNLGFLDGKAGYYFCRLRAIHEFNINAKLYEMKIQSHNCKSRPAK